MSRLLLAATLAGALVAPVAGVAAPRFVAMNNLVVSPSGGPEFHVAFGGLTGATDFWCAAGDYVIRGLGMPSSTQVYRISAPPRHAGEGVDFSLSDARAADSGISRFGAASKGMSAAVAQHYCTLTLFFPFN